MTAQLGMKPTTRLFDDPSYGVSISIHVLFHVGVTISRTQRDCGACGGGGGGGDAEYVQWNTNDNHIYGEFNRLHDSFASNDIRQLKQSGREGDEQTATTASLLWKANEYSMKSRAEETAMSDNKNCWAYCGGGDMTKDKLIWLLQNTHTLTTNQIH